MAVLRSALQGSSLPLVFLKFYIIPRLTFLLTDNWDIILNLTNYRIFNRVIKLTELENRATNPKILVDNIPSAEGLHFVGALTFGPDDKLYVATGHTNQIEQGKTTISLVRF
jgi:Glucose / Sorbosone dehydrogenase